MDVIKKMKKWLRRNKRRIVGFWVIIFNAFLIYSSILLFLGYHAVDTSFNVLKISYDTGTDLWEKLVDYSLDGTPHPLWEVYMDGWKYVIISFIYGIVSAFLLGVGIHALIGGE